MHTMLSPSTSFLQQWPRNHVLTIREKYFPNAEAYNIPYTTQWTHLNNVSSLLLIECVYVSLAKTLPNVVTVIVYGICKKIKQKTVTPNRYMALSFVFFLWLHIYVVIKTELWTKKGLLLPKNLYNQLPLINNNTTLDWHTLTISHCVSYSKIHWLSTTTCLLSWVRLH